MAANATAFAGPPNPALIPAPPTQAAQDLAQTFVGVIIGLNVVSFLLFGGRIWTRTMPVYRLGWDDYITSIAYVSIPFLMITGSEGER